MFTFLVENQSFQFKTKKIPKQCQLSKLLEVKSSDQEVIVIDNVLASDFVILYDYLMHNKVPDRDHVHVLELFNVPHIHSYELAISLEEDMRSNMYCSNDPKYKEPYYGLEPLTSYLWESVPTVHKRDNNLLFNDRTVNKEHWNVIQERLTSLKPLFEIGGVFIGGGSLYSILFGLPISDIDIFIYGCTAEEAEDKIFQIYSLFIKERMCCNNEKEEKYFQHHEDDHWYNPIYCTRTANAITFSQVKIHPDFEVDIQVILRLYQTPSEVLHGFDVDSCSIGFDGKTVWLTHRAWFALDRGYNTVNFNRLSPSYEYRLAKYGTRGMAIKVPKFDRKSVKEDILVEYYEEHKPLKGKRVNQNYAHLKSLKGLNLLLYLEYRCHLYKYRSRTLRTMQYLAEECSDYSPLAFSRYCVESCGGIVHTIIKYLSESSDAYPEFSKQYMPYLVQIDESLLDDPYSKIHAGMEGKYVSDEVGEECFTEDDVKLAKALQFNISSIPKAARISYIACLSNDSEHFKLLLHIPHLIYDCLGVVRPWDFPADLTWKVTNPGQQFTGTFHKLVLENNSVWYNGNFY